MKDNSFRYNQNVARTLVEMNKDGDGKIEINKKDLDALRKKREAMKGSENDLKDFIAVMYNLIMILLWYAFAFTYYAELHKFGLKLTME
jgi:hypothetical protein